MSLGESETARSVQRLVGLRICELRRARGVTQEEFAESIGMIVENFGRIEQGRQNLTIETLVRIALALGVKVSDLFERPRLKGVRPGRPRKRIA